MDVLKSLDANVPGWIKRLEELSSQIEKRQEELARLGSTSTQSATSSPSRANSVRNKGSTESLKPNDDAPVVSSKEDEAAISPDKGAASAGPAAPPVLTAAGPAAQLQTVADLHLQTNQAMQVAQAKARATLRKRNRRSNSVVSAEGHAQKYRTRSMIIVYYDSYVQSFFEELVRFVSASRNLMRKAKMAANVAQIKRMADLELADTEDIAGHSDGDGIIAAAIPAKGAIASVPASPAAPPAPKIAAETMPVPDAVKAVKVVDVDVIEAAPSTENVEIELSGFPYAMMRNLRSPYGMGSAGLSYPRLGAQGQYLRSGASRFLPKSMQGPDIYDELDKELEYVQATSEHAAHQFLRDGDCNEEIENIKRRLVQTREQAVQEMERAKKEDPHALTAAEEAPKTRFFRPQSMRKNLCNPAKGAAVDNPAAAAENGDLASSLAAIEVDEGIDDM